MTKNTGYTGAEHSSNVTGKLEGTLTFDHENTTKDDKHEDTELKHTKVKDPVIESPQVVSAESMDPDTVLLSGTAISGYTWWNANWWYPYLPQAPSGTLTSGGFVAPNISNVGWGSVNTTGFVYQNGQYISRREGNN